MSVTLPKNALLEIEYPYPSLVEKSMKKVYEELSEKDKRIYAAVEALKLPYGGKRYICSVLKCHMSIITRGLNEIDNGSDIPAGRIRENGGGRKKKIDTIPSIDAIFFSVIDNFTAGDPMNEGYRWINLGYRKIAKRMRDNGANVGKGVVKQLLKKHGFGVRKASKLLSIGHSDNRNEQFENIAKLRKEYTEQGNPVISMDTKKKNF